MCLLSSNLLIGGTDNVQNITTGGVTTTIEISEEGKVTYAVGKKKTTFDLSECDSFTYEFEATDEKCEIWTVNTFSDKNNKVSKMI